MIMSIRVRDYLLLFLFLSFGFNQFFIGAVQYESQIIESIEIIPVNVPEEETFDDCAITARMKIRKGGLFSQTDFDNDLKALIQEYDQIEPCINSVDGKLYITLKIWPKPTIRTISWEGNDKIDTKTLHKELGIKTCTIFDRQAFNKAFHKLKTYYVKKGFFEAALDYDVVLDPTTNTVDITINIMEGRAGRIKEIVFVNFTEDEEEQITERMITKTYNILLSWYTEEGTYNEDAMQQDRSDIISFLQNEGYADATVDIDISEAKQCNRIIITITTCRGEPYFFGPITFEGNTLFCNEEIEDLFLFEECDHYSPDDIRNTIRRITELYGRKGYIDALVDYEQCLNPETHTYTINFTIEEGDQYRVGLIKVFGNCTTKTNVILHETLLIPGELFNIAKLERTEIRLKNIGYFSNVNVYPVRSEGPGGLGECYRDVHIEVEETTTGNFGAGFGLSSVESIFGEFSITERNFNHEGLFSFWNEGWHKLRGGGEYVSLTAMIGAKSRKYTLSWTKPFFRDTLWIVGFDLQNSNNRYISEDYDINSSGITIHGSYPLNPFLRLGVHYRLTNAYITLNKHHIHHTERKLEAEGEEELAEGDIKEAKHKFHEIEGLSCKLREEAKNMGLISAIGLTLNYDSRDSFAFPRRGFQSRLEQELAGFGGDHTFMSMAYLNNYYIPAGETGVVRFRGDMRFIVPLFDTKRYHIPIDERLFLGGDSTIRGYRVYRLGPQYNTGDPRGGMSMQLLSAEYTLPLAKRISTFVFCDSGHLSFDVWNFGTMWTSLGFGFNIKVFEGAPPVVLGLGFPINPDRHSDVKRFFFNIGGRF